VSSPAGSLSAVVVSGGKQYRVSPGDRILVDRLAAEPGSEITLDRVLLLAAGDEVEIGQPVVEGATVTARVLRSVRGPKMEVLRYKPKKRVRVRRGARADLTALEILTVAGRGRQQEEAAAATPPSRRGDAGRAAAAEPKAPRKRAITEAPAEAAEETKVGS